MRPSVAHAVALLSVLALLLAACGVVEDEPDEAAETDVDEDVDEGLEEDTLLLGHGADPGNPRSIAAEDFAETVEAETDGRFEVQIQGSEQLGSDVEMLEAIETGTIELTANSQGPFSDYVPEVALFGLPFLFDDSETAYEVLDGEVGDELAAMAEDEGMKVLAWWDNGIRHITNSQQPVEDASDLDGMALRTPEDPMTLDIFETLGASPEPIDFGELYLALEQGTVDGQENPLVNIWASDLHEVQDYLSITGHKYEVTPFVMDMDAWEALSEEDQQILEQAAQDARDLQRQEMQEQSEEIEEDIQEYVDINEADVEDLREATADVYDAWEDEFGELVQDLQDAAQ